VRFEWDREKAKTNQRLVVVAHTERDDAIRLISARVATTQEKRRGAMKRKLLVEDDDLRAEYDFDFSEGERGRYYKRLLKEGSNIVLLEPDIAEAFPDSAAVNSALRSILEFARLSTSLARPLTGRSKKRVPS
jgi:hypothetical protein